MVKKLYLEKDVKIWNDYGWISARLGRAEKRKIRNNLPKKIKNNFADKPDEYLRFLHLSSNPEFEEFHVKLIEKRRKGKIDDEVIEFVRNGEEYKKRKR
ncbi:MAG: hypothetical protein DRN01_03335 [Thermoplasmata archaeon]|nr:MAG: hypothetical protein DRN01_03335 [Thermoplasmata archaeon]